MSLKKLSRVELNRQADVLGIEDAAGLGTKADVIRAIKSVNEGPPSVVEAVEAELASLAERDSGLARSGRAAAAIVLARELDSPQNSATSKSMCSKALNETLDRLDELAPAEKKKDGVHDLNAAREQRRARKARAAG